MNDALPGKCDVPSSIVSPVGPGAGSAIPGPDNYRLEIVQLSHGLLPRVDVCIRVYIIPLTCNDAIGTAAMTPSEIAISLRRDILTGHVAPGSDLPQEELARRFGVSRIPVRDALNLLAAEKLVRIRPNRGAQVICFSRKDLAEVYSLRVILETDCLARAIPDILDVDLERIAQEMRRCEIEAGNEGFPEADWRFHRA